MNMPRGGKRKGAGRKEKFGEPTERVSFRLPISKIPEIRIKIEKLLKEYEA